MMYSFQQIADVFAAFTQDPRTGSLLGMILINIITGVMRSVALNQYDWKKLADFYRTKVIPYVIGYAGLYMVAGVGLANASDPIVASVNTVTVAPLIASLTAAIADNIRPLIYKPSDTEDPIHMKETAPSEETHG